MTEKILSMQYVQSVLRKGDLISIRNSRVEDLSTKTFVGYSKCEYKEIFPSMDSPCSECLGRLIVLEDSESKCSNNPDGSFIYEIHCEFLKEQEMTL
jgi:hypothetical protein